MWSPKFSSFILKLEVYSINLIFVQLILYFSWDVRVTVALKKSLKTVGVVECRFTLLPESLQYFNLQRKL